MDRHTTHFEQKVQAKEVIKMLLRRVYLRREGAANAGESL